MTYSIDINSTGRLDHNGILSYTPKNSGMPLPSSYDCCRELSGKCITKIDSWDAKLEQILPNFLFQTKIDALGAYIEQKFVPLAKFNIWLKKNDATDWYSRLACALAKLPLRVARNIINLLYNTIKDACMFCVHPAKAMTNYMRKLIILLDALTQPKVWPHVGIGMAGTHLGTFVMGSSLIPLIAVGIAAGLIVGGLSFEAFFNGSESAIRVMEKLPETFLTSLCMTALVAHVRTKIGSVKQNAVKPIKFENEKQVADDFVQKNKLPDYSEVYRYGSDRVLIRWNNKPEDNMELVRLVPKFFENEQLAKTAWNNSFRIVLRPDGTGQGYLRVHTLDPRKYYQECIYTLAELNLMHDPFTFADPVMPILQTNAVFADINEAREYAGTFMNKYNITDYRWIQMQDGVAYVNVCTNEFGSFHLKEMFPQLFENIADDYDLRDAILIALRPDGTGFIGKSYSEVSSLIGPYQKRISLPDLKFHYTDETYSNASVPGEPHQGYWN